MPRHGGRPRSKGITKAFLDRLLLTDKRIDGIDRGLRTIAELPDPGRRRDGRMDRPNGLQIQRVRTPLGRHRRDLREPAQRHRRCRRADASSRATR